MEAVNIYLSGAITGLSLEERTKWRSQVRNAILYGGYDLNFKPIFFDPTQYYDIDNPTHENEQEVLDFDLNRLRKSDLIIVNFNKPSSVGTIMELALAYENRIPVVGLNIDNAELHPWLLECTTRMFNDMRKLVDYVVEYFLN